MYCDFDYYQNLCCSGLVVVLLRPVIIKAVTVPTKKLVQDDSVSSHSLCTSPLKLDIQLLSLHQRKAIKATPVAW
jgi:hypothetical protein